MNKERVDYAKFRMYRRIEKGIMTLESVLFGAAVGFGLWGIFIEIPNHKWFPAAIGFIAFVAEYVRKRHSFNCGT